MFATKWTLDSVMVETVLRRSTKLSINQCISLLVSLRVLDARYMVVIYTRNSVLADKPRE